MSSPPLPPTRRRAIGWGLGAISAALGPACPSGRRAPLRVGLNTWPPYELLVLASELGFFADAGLDVQLVEFGSLGDARRAYEVGQVDGLCTTLVELLVAREVSGRDLRVSDVLDWSDGADRLVGRAELTSVADLRGRKVAVEIASLGVYVLARALEREGLGLRDVTLVPRDQRGMREALLQGEVDAIVTYPPESLPVQSDPRFRALFDTHQIPREVVDVLALDHGWRSANPRAVEAFRAAVHRAFDVLQREPDRALPVMAARERLSPEDFAAALRDGIRLASPAEQPALVRRGGELEQVIATTAATLLQVGVLRAPVDPAACLPDA